MLAAMDLTTLLGAFGLSGAAGLNAYIPLLVAGGAARAGYLQLSAPFDLLSHDWVLGTLAVLLVLEMVVDKVPGADHANDVVQSFVRPASGALLFAAGSGAVQGIPQVVGLCLGLVSAFSVHATKAVARPVVTTTTFGLGTPVISLLEDVAALATALLAVFVPVLLVFIALACAVMAVWLFRRLRPATRS